MVAMVLSVISMVLSEGHMVMSPCGGFVSLMLSSLFNVFCWCQYRFLRFARLGPCWAQENFMREIREQKLPANERWKLNRTVNLSDKYP